MDAPHTKGEINGKKLLHIMPELIVLRLMEIVVVVLQFGSTQWKITVYLLTIPSIPCYNVQEVCRV